MAFVEKGLISKFAAPERVEFVDTLPLTSVGKIDKKKLREEYRDQLPAGHIGGRSSPTAGASWLSGRSPTGQVRWAYSRPTPPRKSLPRAIRSS